MRKLALFAAVCAAAVGAAGSSAAPPEHHAIQVHESFIAPFMSEACGVPVTITLDGVARVTLTRNLSGLVVREHDVLTSFTAVFESPLALAGTGLLSARLGDADAGRATVRVVIGGLLAMAVTYGIGAAVGTQVG